jgi:hypothetical protein
MLHLRSTSEMPVHYLYEHQLFAIIDDDKTARFRYNAVRF